MRIRLLAATLLVGLIWNGSAPAQDRPVRMLVGYPAGGPTDAVARLVSERLGAMNKQTWIVENKPGASSVIATQEVVRAAPDGQTLLMAASNHTTNPAIIPNMPYDSANALAAVALVAEGPHVLVAHPKAPFASVKELVAYAKANPEGVRYSSSGLGGTVHFAGAMLEEAAGIKLSHIPYRGAAPAVQDLIGGQVEMSPATLASVSAHVKAGRLKLLAVAAEKRLPDYPEVPTFAELGYPTMVISAWSGIFAPRATPRSVLEKLAGQIRDIVAQPDMVQRLQSIGLTPSNVSLEAFDKQVKSEIETFARIARERGIKGE
ncbi:MAG: tripartite tricarboxylate transporter substrate binding protein [Acetobacteraceae bacterium]|jgi:tripartite-type tricarboxylate transporter receptor subunit TctC|nr:tripartite tricarboxylate transporter substrate binding protein [Acetobacteraceae bacterium]